VITAGDTLVRTAEHVDAPLGDQVAMMDIGSGSYYVLDDIAAFIWARLERPAAVQSLLHELQARYDVAADRCAADVLPFLAHLHDKGLVHTVG
jgi:hypothetical protein